MNDKFFVDTNVLIYCYTVTEPDKQARAQRAVAGEGRCISTQVLQELANTLRRKFKKRILSSLAAPLLRSAPCQIEKAWVTMNRYPGFFVGFTRYG